MNSYGIGKLLIFIGIVLIVLGSIIHFAGGNFSWFGRLPGDIRIERENFRFYFPITTMVLLSIILSILLRIISYFLK